MSNTLQSLRAVVNERLTAAAEEIFALVERTVAEYEEELCRCREENQRKQQLLDSVLSAQLHRSENVTAETESSLKQDVLKTPQIKKEPEEQSRVKQEEEQLPAPPAVSADQRSLFHLLQQRQAQQHQETQAEHWETPGGDISSEPHKHFYNNRPTGPGHSSYYDSEEEWEAPASSIATAQMDEMETEADRDQDNRFQMKDPNITAQYPTAFTKFSTENRGVVSDGYTADGRKHECSVCHKRFTSKQNLIRHTRIHTGEKPYSCLFCDKSYIQKVTLDIHMRTHTGERFCCSFCQKTFSSNGNLKKHEQRHLP